MSLSLARYTDFLKTLGTEEIAHSGDSGFLAHLVAVCRYLEKWGSSEEVCIAGMFHSIYGTELFQGFSLPVSRRSEVRQLAGRRAEHLAYLNCAMDRASFDRLVEKGGAPRMRDRLTGETLALTEQDFHDLLEIQVFDWLEQVGRSQSWDYRRSAYRAMAEQLGDAVVAEYDRVFAQESSH